MLLIGAALLLQSFVRLMKVDPGFRVERLLVVGFDLEQGRYQEIPAKLDFIDGLLRRLTRHPDVLSAAAVDMMPLTRGNIAISFSMEGRPIPQDLEERHVEVRVVSPGYFETLGIRLLSGRTLTQRDRTSGAIVVNEAFTKHYSFSNAEAVGQYLRVGRLERASQIVGVVVDVKQRGLEAETRPAIYATFGQMADHSRAFTANMLNVLIRTGDDPFGVLSIVRNEVRDLDPEMAVFDVTTMDASSPSRPPLESPWSRRPSRAVTGISPAPTGSTRPRVPRCPTSP